MLFVSLGGKKYIVKEINGDKGSERRQQNPKETKSVTNVLQFLKSFS